MTKFQSLFSIARFCFGRTAENSSSDVFMSKGLLGSKLLISLVDEISSLEFSCKSDISSVTILACGSMRNNISV